MQWRQSTTEMLAATAATPDWGQRDSSYVSRGLSLCHAVPLEPCAVGLNCFTLVTVCFNRDFSKPLMPPNNACLLLSILGHCRKRSALAQCKWHNTTNKLPTGTVKCKEEYGTLLLFVQCQDTTLFQPTICEVQSRDNVTCINYEHEQSKYMYIVLKNACAIQMNTYFDKLNSVQS